MTHEPYGANVAQLARENPDYRRVLETTDRLQLVLMTIPVGGEIGEEVHSDTDQALVVVQGRGEARLEGDRHEVGAGDVVIVPAGTRHNVVTSGAQPLRLYTFYSPPHHRPGTVHPTKADADADTADVPTGI